MHADLQLLSFRPSLPDLTRSALKCSLARPAFLPGIFCKGSEEDARWAWCLQRLSWVRLYSSLVFTMQLLELEPALAVAALF